MCDQTLVRYHRRVGITLPAGASPFSRRAMRSPWSVHSKSTIATREALLSFRIGTSLTNDTGLEPLSIVMKMVECNGQPVAKISDSPGKAMCEDDLAYLRQVVGVGS